MEISRRKFLKMGALAASGATLLKGRWNLEHVRLRELYWDTGNDLRVCLLQLTDMHIHQNNWATGGSSVLQEVVGGVKKIAEQCKQHGYHLIVVLTGDVNTCAKRSLAGKSLRSETDGEYFFKKRWFFETIAYTADETYVTGGNHDTQLSWSSDLFVMLHDVGIEDISAGIIIEREGYSLCGLPDWQTQQHLIPQDRFEQINERAKHKEPTLIVGHNADILELFDLGSWQQVLSKWGHTHGYADWYVRTTMGYQSPYVYGSYHLANNCLVDIDGGIGTTTESPGRGCLLNVIPEMTCSWIT